LADKKVKKVRSQLRRDTAANWEAQNPVLLAGEEILVYTNAGETRRKIGDGVKSYTQLPFDDERIYNALNDKQAKVTGTASQIAGFNASGALEARNLPTAAELGAEPSGSAYLAQVNAEAHADSVLSAHDQNPAAHVDIRSALSEKQPKLTGASGQFVGFGADGAAEARNVTAGDVAFADGETFQQKYEAGELTGADGKSPYQAAVADGYTGTEAEFYAALVTLKDAPFLPLSGGTMNINGIDNFVFGVNTSGRTLFRIAGVSFTASSSDLDIDAENIVMSGGLIAFAATNVNLLETESVDVPDPNYETNAANKGYVDAQRPKQQLITLTTSAWENHLPGSGEAVPDRQTYRYQAVSVPGILADESKQLIQPVPTMDAQELYIYHGVRCMQQSENQLIFYCDTVPVDDLSVYIVWQEVQAG